MYPNPCARQTLLRWHPSLSLFAKAGAWTFGLIIGKASERQPNGQGRDVRGFGVRSGRDIANQEGAGAEPRRSLDHALLVCLESAMYGFSLGAPNGNSLIPSVQAADLEDHAVQGVVKIMNLVQFDLAGFLERNRRCLHGAERRGGIGAADLVRGRDLAEIG